jgi:hypothetical protein
MRGRAGTWAVMDSLGYSGRTIDRGHHSVAILLPKGSGVHDGTAGEVPGGEYTACTFGQRCDAYGVRPSMGTVGDCYDNAMAESFFATLECELLARRAFKTRAEARAAIFEYIEAWYNPHRRHSALDYLSPANYERRALQDVASTLPGSE